MNLDKGAIKNSAFAIIAIESVWPNPDGNESPPDFFDYELLGIDPSTVNRAGVKREKFQTTGDSTSVADYQRRKGYYKILPLNVIKVDTQSSLDGSKFTATFTLDDLLLVADEGVDFLNASGLPFKREDLINLGNEKTLPILFGGDDASGWDYVKDEELGLTRYRINGASTSFNIEDLVEPNDTVTIWLYHDPSDFYIKDEIPDFVGGNYEINDSIKNVVGSADRRGQFNDSSTSFQEYVLSTLGLINDFTAQAIESVVEGGESPDISLTISKILQSLDSFVQEGTQVAAAGADDSIEKFERFSEEFGIPTSSPAYKYLLAPYAFPTGSTSDAIGTVNLLRADRNATDVEIFGAPDEEVTDEESGEENSSNENAEEVEVSSLVVESRKLIQKNARESWDFDIKNFDEVDEPFELASKILAYRLQTTNNSVATNNFIIGLKTFKSYLEDVIGGYLNESVKNREYALVNQRFSGGRQALVADFTGETPYLALKGKISDVSVSVGHTSGAYTVTINGSGYEKTLKEQEVFYEPVFFPSGARILSEIEYTTQYILVSPPRAMLDVVNRHAARSLVFKPRDKLGPISTLDLLSHFTQSLEDLDAVKEEFSESDKFFDGNVLARGNYIVSEYATDLDFEDVRVFYPVNFLDTTRVYEMVRALEAAFRPEEALYRNVQPLRGGVSVFQNLRMLGGTEQLYEMFVDETGRLRYRFTFEAYERTPNPAISPTIQDEDVLPGASFTTTDSRLSTLIDLQPADKAVSGDGMDIPFLGRAVPKTSDVPLKNISVVDSGVQGPGLQGSNENQSGLNSINLDGVLSPTLFRYGLQSLTIEDVYTAPSDSAKRKAILYLNAFGEPLKQAQINVVNNTSYRVGNTVLVALQKNKHRSKTLIDVEKFLNWLRYLQSDQELIDFYVGFDERLVMKDSYIPTSSGDYSPIPEFYEDFASNPTSFLINRFIETFDYLLNTLNLNVITPEYFPSTYWFYTNITEPPTPRGEGFVGSNGQTIPSSVIEEFYTEVLDLAVNNNQSNVGAINEKIGTYPGIINALQFQDFRAASYYIESVSHKFDHGRNMITSLNLNYGQDNLVLLEPRNNIPIGFISLEKNMALGYDADEQNSLYLDKTQLGERSGEQNMFLEQFKQNKQFERASLMYQAQKIRNASNYMYKLALLDNLDVTINEFVQESRSSSEILDEYETNTTTFVEAPERETRGLTGDFAREALPAIANFEIERGIDVSENPQFELSALQAEYEASQQDVLSPAAEAAGRTLKSVSEFVTFRLREEYGDSE